MMAPDTFLAGRFWMVSVAAFRKFEDEESR